MLLQSLEHFRLYDVNQDRVAHIPSVIRPSCTVTSSEDEGYAAVFIVCIFHDRVVATKTC